MIECCKVLTRMLMLLLCFLACNSVFVAGDELRCIEKERQALLELKAGIVDEHGFLSSWGSEEHQKECCQWQGVECNHDSGHVITLQLSTCEQGSMQLRIEKVSSALLELNYLSHLDLSCIDFGNSEIPDFIGSMEKLQYLNFKAILFSGVLGHQLANLTNLRTLDLGDNYLVFNSLHWLSRLSSLSFLDLSYNDLKDANSLQDILNLPSLKELYLSGCQFPTHFSINSPSTSLSVLNISYTGLTSSTFCWLFNVSTSLRSIDLSTNFLESNIPSDFGEFVFLEHLDLSYNRLKGGIPKSLGNLSYLQTLDLSYNRLTGEIPKFLGAKQPLEVLDLQRNNLYGSLPNSLWQLSMLEILDVSLNSLGGTISDINLSKLHNLKVLGLSHNSLILRIRADWIPPFQLNILKLARCNIGPRFPTWLRVQKNLSQVDLSYNAIIGEVPKWIWDFSPKLGYLNFSHNQIIGSIPDLSPLNHSILDISSNNFSGPLPSSFFGYSVLLLSDNMFVGSISSICTTSYLAFMLDLSNNQFSGQFPDCWENKTRLSLLNLSNNKLFGNIPHSLGSQGWLKILQLRNNNFSGEFPSTLMNCSRMRMLDVGENNLRGKIPAWIGTHLPKLKVLSIGDNNFFEDIPIEICYLSEIQILDLSMNILSGKLPQCFNNLTSLIQKNTTFDGYLVDILFSYINVNTYNNHVFVQWKRQRAEFWKTNVRLLKLIDLSSNKLVGNVPNEFSQLRALISLNLSGNYLSGHIIPSIGEMEMLQILDLSRNNFSGEIPKSLTKLDRLAVLDLSNNHLFGEIPLSTQLQSFEPSTYAENDGLCGPPLPRCLRDEANPSTSQHGKQENVDDGFMAQLHSHEFYIPIVVGFIVGFWGIIGTLVLNSSWRNSYFDFFSRMGDWLYVTTMIYARRLKQSLSKNVPN